MWQCERNSWRMRRPCVGRCCSPPVPASGSDSCRGFRPFEAGSPRLVQDASARVLRASLPAERTRVETCTPASVIEHARSSDLVVVGRTRTFPWSLVPLARYARRLLRPDSHAGAGCRFQAERFVSPRGDCYGSRNRRGSRTEVGQTSRTTRLVHVLMHVYRGLFESKLQYADVSNADIAEYRLAATTKGRAGLTALIVRHRSGDARRALLWRMAGLSTK